MNIIKVYKQFPTQDDCKRHLEHVRWGDTPICPYCESNRSSKMKNFRYKCNNCNTSYSVTVNTIFHKTKMDFQKWFVAISLVLNAKKGISARQLARDIDVTKDTAWYLLMRLRKAMTEYGDLLQGIVEVDETYVGGKNKNRHADKKTKGGQGRNTTDKIAVAGILQRNGRVIAKKVKDVTGRTLKSMIYENVKKGSKVMTDEWMSYNGLHKHYEHGRVNHGSGNYVNGEVHTNSIEGFWSLLKRGVIGQFHHVSSKYINRYIDEFCFRYNHRQNDEIFSLTLQKALGV